MTALLRIELLGVHELWRTGGPAAADEAFADLHDLVLDTARNLDVADTVTGDLDADGCTIACPVPEAALALGRRVFRRAWLEPRTPDEPRLWLRGVIVDGRDNRPVRTVTPSEDLPGIQESRWSGPAFEAMAALRSGFRGMRLLVADSILTDTLRGMFRIPLGRLGVIPFRRMNHTPYPGPLGHGFQDLLWMAEVRQEWGQYVSRMKQRMLWSSHAEGELAHAAATQVVFHECDAILQSVVRKNEQQDRGASWERDDAETASDPAESVARERREPPVA
jgi:hypothetical protein